MNCESSRLDSSSLSIIKKFLDSEILGEVQENNEAEIKQVKKLFNFETLLKERKRELNLEENHENSDIQYQLSELKLEQQNFEAELEFIQKQLFQEISLLIKKILDKNQLVFKQQEQQLQQVIQRRLKQASQSPYQSHSLFYVMNPYLQQYQQYNKDLKDDLVKLLQTIKQGRIQKQLPQQAQTSRSPLSQLNKLFSRQGSQEKPKNVSQKIKNNFPCNIILPSKRDTQSFWNQPSERKCSITTNRIHSPYEKRDKGLVQQALYKQSSEFLKFRC